MNATTVTIGFIREDGDIEVLAAFNNSGECIDANRFNQIVRSTVKNIRHLGGFGSQVRAWLREDLIDVISDEEDGYFGEELIIN